MLLVVQMYWNVLGRESMQVLPTLAELSSLSAQISYSPAMTMYRPHPMVDSGDAVAIADGLLRASFFVPAASSASIPSEIGEAIKDWNSL